MSHNEISEQCRKALKDKGKNLWPKHYAIKDNQT